MKLALLMGNRFSPWHTAVFDGLNNTDVTVFRADSEIQAYFDGRTAGPPRFATETIPFVAQGPGIANRLRRSLRHRLWRLPPKLEPFSQRLQGFDRILTWELFTDWTWEALEAKARYGTKLSVMVWDTIPFHFDGDNTRRRIRNRCLAEADRFIVYTECSRRVLLLEGVDPTRIDRVPPAVDCEVFAPALGHPSHLATDAFVVAFVGWFLPRKGLDYLVLALADLARRVDRPLHLHMVGSGPGRDRIEGLLARLKPRYDYTFAGSTTYDAMPAVYQAANAFVLPSINEPDWQEQFGMSLIEAMACGRPVISTHSGAIPEIIGDAGVLVPPNDFAALSDALEDLVQSPELCSAMGEAARARALEWFDLPGARRAMAEALNRC